MSDQVKMVDVDTLRDWIDNDEVVVVDVREQNEYDAYHIAGAHLVPLSSFDMSKLPKIPDGKKLLLHCRSARRCGSVAEMMLLSGYKGEINRLEGGIESWVAAGAPVE